MSSEADAAAQKAAETMEVLYEISQLLNTGLDRTTLSILTSLCECGVSPEALANAVKELRREKRLIDASASDASLSGLSR
jgi:mitotic-spindle organizing protein 1